MPQPDRSAFSQWLEGRYLAWMKARGQRLTVTEFGRMLGVSKGVVTNWLNGRRRPSQASMKLLAKKLGEEVYDVLGQPRPDPDLQKIIQQWPDLTEAERRALRESCSAYVAARAGQSRVE